MFHENQETVDKELGQVNGSNASNRDTDAYTFTKKCMKLAKEAPPTAEAIRRNHSFPMGRTPTRLDLEATITDDHQPASREPQPTQTEEGHHASAQSTNPMQHTPSNDLQDIFSLCRNNHWQACLQALLKNPLLGTAVLTMDNGIVTTVCHLAITSKGKIQERAAVVLQILFVTPQAARIRNGYGSLCLHCVCQRNVRIDSTTKEKLIQVLVDAFPGALLQEGSTGHRTPLHIMCTDYCSSDLFSMMLERGKSATFMRDRKGWLPLHIAASHHISPYKVNMLLKANPESILATTPDGLTALQLVMDPRSNVRPNLDLVQTLRTAEQLESVLSRRRLAARDNRNKHSN